MGSNAIGGLQAVVSHCEESVKVLAERMCNRPIDERCDNWGQCLRYYVPGWHSPALLGGDGGSAESKFSADDHSGYRQIEAHPSAHLDVNDAKIVESAVVTLPLYQHALLKAHYVRSYSPGKCLALAAEAAGVRRVKFRGFLSDLEMAHALLIAALRLPAVVRKVRARELVRERLA